MNLLKKCLIEFNNQWTNKITEKEVDDDEQLRFTLLDMQKFAKKYVEAINVIQCCETVKEKYAHTFEVDPDKWNSAYDRCNEITKILKAPSKVYLYDGENYIELKP